MPFRAEQSEEEERREAFRKRDGPAGVRKRELTNEAKSSRPDQLLSFFGKKKMSGTKIKLTIDTNLINARQQDQHMNKIEQWRDEGRLSIVGTYRLKTEIAAYKKPAALDKEKKIPNVHEPLVLGKSRLGSSYLAPSDDNSPQFWDMSSILFPGKDYKQLSDNESNDVMHLMGHYYAKADIFVTNDTKDFVKDGRGESLKEKFGIVVMTPQEVVDEFSKRYGWS